MRRPEAIVFDAYGTLLDVHSVLEEARLVLGTIAPDVVDLWRAKQLEYSWLRTLIGTYIDFGQVSRDALSFALASHRVSPSEASRRRLLDAWFRPHAFPDVPQTVAALRRAGLTLAILSNGTPEMLELALGHSGLAGMFAAVLSVDEVRRFKPDWAVYELVQQRLHTSPEQTLFVSSNGFDVAGAKAYGFTVCWVNRSRRPLDELGQRPDFEIASMRDLQEIVG
jgi:2-haloacid dehalogenase